MLGDLRRGASFGILAPLLGQIQRPAQRHRPLGADRMHRDVDLAVADLAEGAGVLALDPWRAHPVLGEAGVVEHPGLHLDLADHPLGGGAHHLHRSQGLTARKFCRLS